MSLEKNLKRAVKLSGGAAELGRRLGITSQAVSNWTICPVRRAKAVEEATGGEITREMLRPDVFSSDGAQSESLELATDGKVTRAQLLPHVFGDMVAAQEPK